MASPTTRQTLIDHCLRRLGAPVIEINVDEDQIEDRVDDAIQVYQEYHMDATFRTYYSYKILAADVTNKYITIPADILYITRMFPIASSASASRGMFDVKYQMMLNDVYDMNTIGTDLAYYEQLQQHLSLLDMKLNGTPQVTYARRQDRLYIHGEFETGQQDLKVDDYVVLEVFKTIDPTAHTQIYNDKFIKAYVTALIKQQWGQNLIKFEGMVLPGGVTLNGRQIYDDATEDIEKLVEAMRLEFEAPMSIFIG
jgi:hypothetical protein|tara:strand:- start:1396 stop:2157 length:762 start_codon:yes stop_codon:yes gene_type:complete